ncbi:MAG: potassium transporter TrkG [Ilumatobacteraceae bacterium]
MDVRRAFRVIENPAQLLVVAFLALIAAGTVLLSLPFAADGQHPGVVNALFMSTSAVTITGMTSFSISELSLFGELVVLLLIQIGGFGIMSIGTVLGLVTARRMGLRQRMLARAEIGTVEIGELRALMIGIVKITALVEGAVAVILALRFWQRGGQDPAEAAYNGIYNSVAAFNNAGMTPSPDSLVPYVDDPVIVVTVSLAIILGGLGFPVILELWRRTRPRAWTLHTKLVLSATAGLLVVGPLVVVAFEWTNPETLGPLDVSGKLLASWFQGVTPRSAGFNTVSIADLNEPTLLVMTGLMFIGTGPASTGGGIRITTFALLGYVLWSVVRGDTEATAFRRTIPPIVVRQAITVVLLGIGAVFATTLALLALSDFSLAQTLFEATSAFGTVGLTMGITPELNGVAQGLLMVMMLTGRVGAVTIVTALALRQRPRLYHYPEERPIVG